LDGDLVRRFKLGWAPDEWDALARQAGIETELLRVTGLAFANRAGRMQDSFRARVLFPIFSAQGDAVALGGRVLPGSSDPAKYKNSPETPIYSKSRTLYGLNWAKADVTNHDQVVVCEGYTDVIGFHRAGVPRAVATCGTSFTEEHLRLLKRFANRIVLAFDADAAGQGAAERFYEWERKHQIQVSVARLPDGVDPDDLARRDPAALAAAVSEAVPFLAFRLRRVVDRRRARTPEERASLARDAMAVVNEHPDVNVRTLYAGEVAAQTGLAVADLVSAAKRRVQAPAGLEPPAIRAHRENAEFAALAVLAQDWNSIASWLIEELFSDDVNRRAFLTLATTEGELAAALEAADPDARDILERAAVADLDVDPEVEARNLIAAAVRRQLATPVAGGDPQRIRDDAEARLQLEDLARPIAAAAAAGWLLGWLHRRMEQRAPGGD
jgi:DNA primase